jgi:hypothetical protein
MLYDTSSFRDSSHSSVSGGFAEPPTRNLLSPRKTTGDPMAQIILRMYTPELVSEPVNTEKLLELFKEHFLVNIQVNYSPYEEQQIALKQKELVREIPTGRYTEAEALYIWGMYQARLNNGIIPAEMRDWWFQTDSTAPRWLVTASELFQPD